MRASIALVAFLATWLTACSSSEGDGGGGGAPDAADDGASDASAGPDGSASDAPVGDAAAGSFTVSVSPASLVLPQGASATTAVSVVRAPGFTGPIVVTASGVPGVTAQPLTIAAGATSGTLTLSAAATGAPQATGKLAVDGADATGLHAGASLDLLLGGPPGSLDTTFGDDGVLVKTYGESVDLARAAVIQADGKIVVAGGGPAGGGTASIVRYLPNGSVDASFGVKGRAIFGGTWWFSSVALQPDGKIVAAFGDRFGAARFNADGTIDKTFGGSGSVQVSSFCCTFPNPVSRAVAVQPDGKILLAGNAVAGVYSDLALARFTSSGTRDTTIPDTYHAFVYSDVAAMALDTNGATTTILVAGTNKTTPTSAATLFLSRLDAANGASVGGGASTTIATGGDTAAALVVQPDHKVVLGATGADGHFELARYDAAGALDPSFDADGIVTTDLGATSVLHALALSGTSIVAVGTSADDFAVVRYGADGSLDPSFDTDGKVTTGLGAPAQALGAAVQSDGKIVAVGWTNDDFAVVRYATSGALDTSFDTDGEAVTDVVAAPDELDAVVVQPDGKIVVAGTAGFPSGTPLLLARFDADGSPDPTWGAIYGPKCSYVVSSAPAVLLQPDGKIVVVMSSGYDLCVARYLPNGALDASFGTAGVATRLNGGGAYGGALRSDGRVLVVGQSSNIASPDVLFLRFTAAGVEDSPGGGVFNFGAPSGGRGVALLAGDGAVVLGQEQSTTSALVARFGGDGALDASFGTGGKTLVPGVFAEAVGTQAGGKIVFSTSSGLVRLDTSGALDAAFGTGGKLTTNIDGRGLVVQPDDAIVVTGSAIAQPAEGMKLARSSPNGALDTTFGAGGVVTIPRGSQGHAVARMPDGRLVAVGAVQAGSSDSVVVRVWP